MDGEIIEDYPDYWLNPACLIFGYSVNNKILHVVVGIDDYIHILTAYFLDKTKFKSNMKTSVEYVFLLQRGNENKNVGSVEQLNIRMKL